MSLLLLSLSSFFFYTLLCILIASLSICTSFFLFGVPVPLLRRVVSFCQPLSRSFCHCLFPSYPRGSHSSFQLEGESPRGCPSRSPRRFKLLMSIFRLVTLSELVHRRRCVLPIKVFNESERKMGPGTTAIALLLRASCRYPLSAYTRYILIDIHGRFDNLFIMQRFNK